MLRLDKVIKPWKESAALNDHITSTASGTKRPSSPRAAIWAWFSVFPAWTTKVWTARSRSMR